jgi:hypothetical protein
MTIAISFCCAVIATVFITVAVAALSLSVMCCGQNFKRTESKDWTLRFLHRSETVWDFVKILRSYLCGLWKHGRTTERDGGRDD